MDRGHLRRRGLSIGGIALRGLNLGVEFTGGRLMEYAPAGDPRGPGPFGGRPTPGFPKAVVQSSSGEGGKENITVRVDDITNDEAQLIEESLAGVAGNVEKERDELVGPSLGKELRDKALIAFGIAIAAQMIYLAWRFRWTYAAAAVLSMSSVVLTVVGVFAWWGKPIDGVFLAAVLSIIGLAVNDTIVVFDRIREHTRENHKRPLREVVNEAILQTIPERSTRGSARCSSSLRWRCWVATRSPTSRSHCCSGSRSASCRRSSPRRRWRSCSRSDGRCASGRRGRASPTPTPTYPSPAGRADLRRARRQRSIIRCMASG